MNLIKEIPFDVIQRILYYVRICEIISFLRTCKDYALYFEPDLKIEGKNTFWENVFFIAFGYRIPCGSQFELKKKIIEENKWKSKKYNILKADETWNVTNIDLRFYRTSCVHWNSEVIIWGDNKGEICARYAKNNDVILRSKFHSGLVWGLKMIGNTLYSVSDCSPFIGVFEIEDLGQENINLKPLFMITHENIEEEENKVCMWVIAVSEKGHIYAGDNRGYIYHFDSKGNFIKKFNTDSGGIFSMNCIGEELVLVGCTSGLIACYSLEGERVNSVQLTEKDYARSISLIGDNIIVGTTNCKIQLRTTTLELIWEIQIMNSKSYTLNELTVYENYIISTGVGIFNGDESNENEEEVIEYEKEKQKDKKKSKVKEVDYGVWVKMIDHRQNLILTEQILSSKTSPVSRVYHISKVKNNLCLAAGGSSYTFEIDDDTKEESKSSTKIRNDLTSNNGDGKNKKLSESCLIS